MKIIIGNWKMNKTQAETKVLIKEICDAANKSSNLVIACVPFTDLTVAVECAKNSKLIIGAQNAHWAENGAYTGEISVQMLKEIGVKYVIIGHSERRQYFNETNETVLKRTIAVINGGLKPIVCIGESLFDRNNSNTEKFLKDQIARSFAGITPEMLSQIIVAYEPIWAIGTGKTATNDDANNTIAYIRSVFENMYGSIASTLPILYGGSMNEKNASDLLHMPHIDGGLIGGASLISDKFAAIINAFHQ
ncbi:MAG: triose-phosphate isomerase [Clostridia bacterium]